MLAWPSGLPTAILSWFGHKVIVGAEILVGRRGRPFTEAAVYLAGSIVQRGTAFVVVPFATRILGSEGFGVFGVGLALANVLSAILALGLNFSIVRLVYEEPLDAPATRWAMLLRVQLAVCALLGGTTFALGPLWGEALSSIGWGGVLKASVLYGALLSIQTTVLSLLRALHRPVAFTVVAAGGALVGAPVALVLADALGPAGYLMGLSTGAGTSVLLGLVLTHRQAIWERAAIAPAIVLSAPFVAHWLSGWVLGLSDRLIIERYDSLANLGRYTLAYTLSNVLFLLLDSGQSAWAPHYYGGLGPAAKRRIPGRLAVPITALAAAAIGGLVTVMPYLFPLFAPAEFGYPALVIALVASVGFVRVPYFLFMTVLIDTKRSGPIARASAMAAALSIVGNLILVPHFGIEAAALSTFVAFGVQSLLMMRAARVALEPWSGTKSLLSLYGVSVVIVVALGALPQGPSWWALRAPILVILLIVAMVAGRLAVRRYATVLRDSQEAAA